MWKSAAGDAASLDTRQRRAELSLLPFAAVIVTLGLAVLCGISLPNSEPPSQHTAISAVIAFWLSGLAALVVCAVCAPNVRRGTASFVVLASALSLFVVGLWVSHRFDVAWIDSCEFGSGSGDRCIVSGPSAPTYLLVAWPVAGLLISGVGAGIVAIAHQLDGA